VTEQLRFIAITVPDLEGADAYYSSLFDMQVVTREAHGPDGGYQLPHDKGWADARAAGIELYMLGLRRGRLVVALFDEASSTIKERTGGVPRRPFNIGVRMNAKEIAAVRARVGEEEPQTQRSEASRFRFRDRYEITWQLDTSGEFLGNGDAHGKWLQL